MKVSEIEDYLAKTAGGGTLTMTEETLFAHLGPHLAATVRLNPLWHVRIDDTLPDGEVIAIPEDA